MALPDDLVRISAHFTIDKASLRMKRDVDRFVTTPFGYLTLASAGYRSRSGKWDGEALANDLVLATSTRLVRPPTDRPLQKACATVADRVVAVARFLELPGGVSRKRAFNKLAPVEPGRPPLRPIRVTASRHPQFDVQLDVDGPVRIRFIDVAPAGHEHVVLLIHGHSSRLEEYEGLIEHLLPKCRVIVCDLPGCGYADKPDREYRLDWYERVLLALLDARGVGKCVVAGGSLGGNLTLRLGLRAPQRFSRLVSWAPAGWWKTNDTLANGARLLDEVTFWSSLRIQAETWFSRDNPDRIDAIEEAIEYRIEVFGPGFLRSYKDVAWEQTATTMEPRAKDVAVPTLLMVGKNDHALDMHAGVLNLSRKIPGAKLVEYDGAHSIADEHTADVARQLVQFAR
jgi:pimeloyl-ACP methyl ester carboxylesterase